MHQYLVSQGYWSYIKGAQENQANSSLADHPAWKQAMSHVQYCPKSCVHDPMLGHIQEGKTLKEGWGNLRKLSVANTAAHKLQLH